MSFKRIKKPKQSIELVSLIDMIFILLVFFLVTSFVIRMPLQERGLFLPTPKNTLGRAQIVLQMIDEEQAFWLDESVSSIVESVEQNYGYLSQERLKSIIFEQLIDDCTHNEEDILSKLYDLRDKADARPREKYFVLIRCPNEIPYYRVLDFIAILSDSKYRNIKYGCTAGTLDQIQNCKRIYTVVERDQNGKRRKNLRIDFN